MNASKLVFPFIIATVLAAFAKAQTNTLPATGNVGIGTTTPSSALEIALARNDTVGTGALTLNGLQKYSFRSTATLPANGLAIDAFNGATWSTPLVIDNTGNVGIGTVAPAAKLEVIGGARPFGLIVEGDGVSANARIALRRANATGTSATGNIDWIGNDNAVGARIGVNDDIAGSMAFKLGGGTLGYTRMFISSAGNVGIGTTNPTEKLTVVTAGNQLTQIQFGVSSATAGVSSAALTFAGWGIEHAGINWIPNGSLANGRLDFAFGGSDFPGNNTTRVSFLANGNVGIGTTAPVTRLHVAGGDISVDTDHGLRKAGDNWIVGYQSSFPAVVLGSGSSVDKVVINAGGVERARFDTNGNVGIGTTSPTHKLAVNGTIRAKEVIVDTGWADYVFADDYRLAPLSEVESHIKTEKHLPGIPSAAEVGAGGVSLGYMQAKLLAKVEELTLHVIAQEKQMKAMQAAHETEIAALRQQLSALSSHP